MVVSAQKFHEYKFVFQSEQNQKCVTRRVRCWNMKLRRRWGEPKEPPANVVDVSFGSFIWMGEIFLKHKYDNEADFSYIKYSVSLWLVFPFYFVLFVRCVHVFKLTMSGMNEWKKTKPTLVAACLAHFNAKNCWLLAEKRSREKRFSFFMFWINDCCRLYVSESSWKGAQMFVVVVADVVSGWFPLSFDSQKHSESEMTTQIPHEFWKKLACRGWVDFREFKTI